jgi:membrane protease YdiL (CAAX protease family)
MNAKDKIIFVLINIFSFVAFSYLLNKIFIYFFSLKDLANSSIGNEDFVFDVVLIVLIGPLLETLIFQAAIIEGVYFFFNSRKYYNYYSCGISTILFGLTHFYSFPYFIYGLIIGLYLSILYLLTKRRGLNSIIVVLIVHMCWNLIAVINNNS